jgi:hypothetical protein
MQELDLWARMMKRSVWGEIGGGLRQSVSGMASGMFFPVVEHVG